jgi:hypothetical protein
VEPPASDAPPTLAELVIDAYGKGEIELEAVPADTRKDAVYVLPGGNTYTLATIGAVIDAYAAGEIALEAVDPKTRKDAVYLTTGVVSSSYTCQTVASFLGWTNRASDGGVQPTRTCRIAFDAWHAPRRLVRMPQVRRSPAPTMHRSRASARAWRGG